MLGIGQAHISDQASLGALSIGMVAFVAAVTVARKKRPAPDAGARTDRWSLVGASVQGLAIGIAAFRIRPGDATPDWINAAEIALLMAAAVALFVWSSRTMGSNWAIVARTRSDHQLVTTGPFALVRNPIYVAMLFLLLAVAMATHHERALVLAMPLFIVGTLIRTSIEERLLRAQFGSAYDDYAGRVKRFIPGVI